jgi:hypothetical protein
MTCHLLCFNLHRSTGSKEDRISLVSAVQREVFNTLKQSEPYVTQFPGVNDMTVRAAQIHSGLVITCGSCGCEGNTTSCHPNCRQLQQQPVSGQGSWQLALMAGPYGGTAALLSITAHDYW